MKIEEMKIVKFIKQLSQFPVVTYDWSDDSMKWERIFGIK